MFCNHCGSELVDGDAFCWNCGTPVQADASSAVTQRMDDAFTPRTQPAQSDAGAYAPTVAMPTRPAQNNPQQSGRPQPPNEQYAPQQQTQCSPQQQYQPQGQAQYQAPLQQQKRSNTGLIVGIIIGVAVLIAAVLIVVFVIKPFGPASPQAASTSASASSAAQSSSNTSSSSSSSSASTRSSSSTSAANNSRSVTLSVTTAGGERITGTVNRDANGYVIADSSSREYSYSELKSKNLSDAELCIAWNEPFARNGYHFKNADLQRYFESCSWYRDTGNSSNLTGAAAANNATLRRIAEERASASRWMDLASG